MTEAQQQQRYRVVERLASGGMAEVFIAESAGIEGFKKRVAIKRVLPSLSEKKRFISMFLDEARLSAHLSHSNCVQVFDIGVGDNAYFIVMEYVDGADLKAIIDYQKNAGRTFPMEVAVLIAVRICEGLTYAHELTTVEGKPLHIVHRDMSPPNVLITKHGEVKIVDFGLAKASSQLEKSEPGIIKGKFSYLAPEAALGGDVDHRADIFAVGIILWELLSGRRLFLGDTDFATVKQVQQANVPRLSPLRPDAPDELDRILARALAKDPDRRYASARDLGRDLTGLLYRLGRPVSSFDIAELVRGSMALRKKQSPDKANLINKLIEEALFEFTSLQEDDGNAPKPTPQPTHEPLKLGGGFENIGNWAHELAPAAQKAPTSFQQMMRQTISGIEVGNLAALEEATPMTTLPSEPPPSVPPHGYGSVPPPSGYRPSSFPPGAMQPARPPGPVPQSVANPPASRRSGGMIATLVVLVLVVGLAAGAWLTGLIPH